MPCKTSGTPHSRARESQCRELEQLLLQPSVYPNNPTPDEINDRLIALLDTLPPASVLPRPAAARPKSAHPFAIAAQSDLDSRQRPARQTVTEGPWLQQQSKSRHRA